MNSPTVDRDSHVVALIRSRQALEADPDDIAAHFNQALTLCQLGQWEEAVAIWEYVLQKEPDNAFAYVNMGIVLLELEHWKQAEDAFTQAVRCRSDHAAAHFGLGLARAQQGQNEAAKAAWEETLRLDPNHAEARYNLDFLVTMQPESTLPESLLLGSESVSSEHMPPEQTEDASATLSSPLSSTIASTVQVEYEVTSQISMLPVMQASDADAPLVATAPEENTQAPAENRIKLPSLSGPPLDTIAQSVISAQQDALTAQVAATTGEIQSVEAQKPAQARVSPTLRLDNKELHKEHRRMRRQEASVQNASTDKQSRGKWIVGGAMVLLVIVLAVWKAQGVRIQAESVPPSVSSDAPITSPSLSSRGQSPLPAPAASPSALASPAPPTLPDTASANVSHAPHVSDIPTSKSAKPAVKPSLEHATADNNASSPASHVNATHRPRADTTAAHRQRVSETRHTPQAAQTARPNPAVGTRHVGFHDEDTFPTHSHSGHTDNSDEWTDKIP